MYQLPPFTLKLSVQSIGGSSVEGFSAIKMTALGRPQFLVGIHIVVNLLFFFLKEGGGLTQLLCISSYSSQRSWRNGDGFSRSLPHSREKMACRL